jgi:2-methylisocitrate lyase-like PEP mutase family enzyme
VTTTDTAPARLRALLAGPAMVRAPGVYDGLGAHLAREAGFEAVYLTGAGTAAAGFGLPDVGLVTATEMAERARVVVDASRLPVIADADTGYGNPLNAVRTVRSYEQAGVAALHLEDQAFPKRCGHLAGKELVEAEAFVRTLAAALEAREADTVVIARTDARGPAGLDEAIARGRRYAAEGADLVFVEAPESVEEIERIAGEIDAPLVFNVVPGGRSPAVEDAVLEKLGFALAIHPGALLGPVVAAMGEALTALGGTNPVRETGPAGLFRLVGLEEWTAIDRRHAAPQEADRWA